MELFIETLMRQVADPVWYHGHLLLSKKNTARLSRVFVCVKSKLCYAAETGAPTL